MTSNKKNGLAINILSGFINILKKNHIKKHIIRIFNACGYSINKIQKTTSGDSSEKRVFNDRDFVLERFYSIPQQTIDFCGDVFHGKTVLDLGCGDGVTDFGLLKLGIKKIYGLDIDNKNDGHFDRAIKFAESFGVQLPGNVKDAIEFINYDGTVFPLPDKSVDIIFSWSAFEHINKIPVVLAEMKRVLKNEGFCFIQVFPWFHTRYGGHLDFYITEPYFHLKYSNDLVKQMLEDYIEKCRGDKKEVNEFSLMKFQYPGYVDLNRYSADMFYEDLKESGFKVVKAEVVSYVENPSIAPPELKLSEIMISGTKFILNP